jgi:hypothetical protein
MTGLGDPIAKDAGKQTAKNPGDEQGLDEEQRLVKEHDRGEEHGPSEETAEQRRQRRLQRELALRALI